MMGSLKILLMMNNTIFACKTTQTPMEKFTDNDHKRDFSMRDVRNTDHMLVKNKKSTQRLKLQKENVQRRITREYSRQINEENRTMRITRKSFKMLSKKKQK